MKLIDPARHVGNLYHLLTVNNLSTLLVENGCKSYVEEILNNVERLSDQRRSPVLNVQYVRAQDLEDEDDVAELLFPESQKTGESSEDTLRYQYDLLVVRQRLVYDFLPLMHRALYILIMVDASNRNDGEAQKHQKRDLVPFVKMNETLDGTFYVNDFHSIAFQDLAKIGIYERTYIRDLPQRFMVKAMYLAQRLLQSDGDDANANANANANVADTNGTQRELRVLEIGSCSTPLLHHLDEVSTTCCTESAHSTFFLCTLKNARVLSVDVSTSPNAILEKALNDGWFDMNSTLVSYQEGSIHFLQRYADKYRKQESRRIGLLCLDAYSGASAAEKNLEVYEAARMILSRKCLILIADTDEKLGGKGKKLLPRALRDGFIVLFSGRMTLLYRGSRHHLYTT